MKLFNLLVKHLFLLLILIGISFSRIIVTEVGDGYSVTINNTIRTNDTIGPDTDIDGFYHIQSHGIVPAVPVKKINLIGNIDNYSISIDSVIYDTIHNIRVENAIPILPIIPGEETSIDNYPQVDTIYSKDEFWPSSLFDSQNNGKFRGVDFCTFSFYPFRYNPVKSKVIVPKILKISIILQNRSSIINLENKVSPILNKLLSFPITQSLRKQSMPKGYSLIITTDEMVSVAEKLSVWQKLKGYDSEVLTDTIWSRDQLITKIGDYFSNQEKKPGYLLILGNTFKIPEYGHLMYGGAMIKPDTYPYYQGIYDQSYGCFSDTILPDISIGRIPANTVKEAENAIGKILTYEVTPEIDTELYKNALVGAQTQSSFKTSMNVVAQKLTNSGYTVTKFYDTNAGLISKFNDGVFYAAHYDHGIPSGWGTPSFRISDFKSLTYGNKMPVVVSINCMSGQYDINQNASQNPWPPHLAKNSKMKGFAESLLYLSDTLGGSPAIIAATGVTLTGFNDNLLKTISNDIIDKGDSALGKIGDILDYAKAKLVVDYGSKSDWEMYLASLHNRIYQCFSDPTLEVRNMVPHITSAVFPNIVTSTSNSVELSNISLSKGTAVLYNASTDNVISRKGFEGTSCNLSIAEGLNSGDSVIVAITGRNSVPLIHSFIVDKEVPVSEYVSTKQKSKIDLKICDNKILINSKKINEPFNISIYNTAGKVVKQICGDSNANLKTIELSYLSAGVYYLKHKYGNNIGYAKFNIIK